MLETTHSLDIIVFLATILCSLISGLLLEKFKKKDENREIALNTMPNYKFGRVNKGDSYAKRKLWLSFL